MGHPVRLSLLLDVAFCALLWGAGCASTYRPPEDLARTDEDLTTATPPMDLSGDAPGADLAAPIDMAAPTDLATPVDLAGPADLATTGDMAMAGDLATPDMAAPRDMATPDMASPDMATPDMASPPDLATPDLASPADLAAPSPHIVAVLVGDGAAALSSAAQRASLHRYRLDGTEVSGGGWPVSLPVAASGAQHAFTLNGTATSEGALSRSADGRYLVLAGYGAAPGTTGPNSGAISTSAAMTVHRVVARVNAAGQVDTSSAFNTAYDAANIRGATSIDGAQFWTCGSSGGVQLLAFGAVAAGTPILATPANTRVPLIIRTAGDQLYATAGSAGYTTLFTVGSGAPTVGGQSAGLLPGLPTTNASPYAFALLDRDANVAGLDTLYLADDKGVGIQKWRYSGATWTLAATFSAGFTTGTRGLVAVPSAASVTLIASSAEALPAPNTLMIVVDDGSPSPTARPLVTAPMNTQLRGVALAP